MRDSEAGRIDLSHCRESRANLWSKCPQNVADVEVGVYSNDTDMILPAQNYLKAANVQDNHLHYEWDDWRTLPAATTPDDELVMRLNDISQRATLAFACGSAEWIVFRLAKLTNDQAPWDYLVAAWAMVVDVRYGGYGTASQFQGYSHLGWDGPVRKPIRNALQVLEAALQEVAWNKTDPARRAGKIAALACYIMNDATPYKHWRERVLERLESLYPRNPDDPLGDVVPRQAVDPEFSFRVEQTEALTNQFLASLDYRSNMFLSPPDGMLEHFEDGEDFVGTPYAFDIELDRRVRLSRIARSASPDE